MKLQQIQNLTAATGSGNAGGVGGSGAYKMADLTKKMSLDNPTQILTAHDLTSLRTLQRVITTTSNNNNHNNTSIDDHIVYNSHVHSNNNSNSSSRNHNYNLNHNSNSITTNGASNHHTNNSSNGSNASAGNLVFSTIPLDGHALLIQQSHLLPANAAASLTNNGLQQATQARGLVTTATNGLRAGNSNNINTVTSSISPAVSNAGSFISSSSNINSSSNNNSLNNFLAKATILSAANFSNAKPSGKIFNTGATSFGATGGSNMPTTSKYVLLQPNGNGQFTTYEGSTPAAAAAAAANGNAGAPSVGNIVLLATEPMDLNGSSGLGGDAAAVGRVIATGAATGTGDNDEELRPLAWLNDSNLIKGIVTTTAAGAGGANVKRGGGVAASSGNICIVSASNAHDLIEELPHHVGSEEVTTTTPSGSMSTHIGASGGGIGIGIGNGNTNNNITSSTELKAGTQITALSVSDFQQLKRYGNIITSGTPITLLPPHDPTAAAGGRKDEAAHIFGNIGAISATTTVHMGPSGTTTVVEYKSNGNMPTLQSRQLLSAAGVGNASGGTTITPANLSNNGINNNANSSSSNNLNSCNYVPSSFSSTTSTHSTVSSTPASIAASNPASLSVSYSTLASTTMSVAGANSGTTVLSLPKQLTTLPGGVVTVTNGNGTTNTIYQGQPQQQQQSQQRQQNFANNNTNASSSASSTTHHPHKKYLREKMNVLDHGGGGGGVGSGGGGSSGINASTIGTTNGGGNAAASTITVVASPASSSSSLSSSVSSSSSTAAVNGGNSPISKSFYAGAANNSHNNSNVSGGGSNASSSGAINYSSTANTSSPMVQSNATTGAANANSAAGSPIAAGIPPTYTIMQYQSVASSPSISSPEPNNSKEFYPLITTQQQQHNMMRSPTSYSSYDNDSLKDFEISTNGSSSLGHHNTSTPQHQTHQSAQAQQQLSSSGSSASSKNSLSGSMTNVSGLGGGSNGSGAVTPQKQKHPNNVPYDPFVHTHNKPPYSFSSLIFMAIEGSNEKALPVKEIYAWIMQHFPYFKTAPAGWKNSVRHNLSLNKSFVKVEKAPNMGKGSLWRVEPQQRQNLIQALNRSPFFPNSAVDKSSSLKSPGAASNTGAANDSLVGYDTVDSVGSGGGGACSPAPKSNINPRIDPRLFPKLSKVIGGQGLLNDVVVSGAGDVPEEDTPSDYSTTNHNSILNNQISGNNKHSSYNSSPVHQNGAGGGGGGSGSGGVVSSGASILGPFSSYESIESLARDCGADSIDDVNAATAMLALKHGPKVFSETFQNGAPVITSSPSEDHTYSAGGGGASGGNSGASTPLINGNSAPTAINGNAQYGASNGQQPINGCNGDNQSNYTSSDAAYESSEDNNNITPEELEDQRRQREGVDALLSLSRSSVVESPTKRPSSTSVEEEHISACLENNKANNNNGHFTNGNGKMALLTSAVAYSQQQQQHHAYEDSGSFHLPSYYGGPHQLHHHQGLGSGSAVQRKIKPLRSLRTKIKRKAPWMSKAR
ncbi:PREDICTED: putative GPI-anchored protein PB15E9.01c isoform X1 [Rhagoletis zephyria]|uniref:putative GPI-anchored protein PB15E9.01c isoform X1 n=2 Tax=Rhagoletis zephyria TaxID=28612 RepID=UPI0008112650|nr:PREDICTED: putative GPI-anchored protein PB15E9.01c isoform X1 [Rhagoletis zephyria]